MCSDLCAIDPYCRIEVHCSEVQQYALTLPGPGDVKRSMIPKTIILADRLGHARQSGLSRKWHEYLPVERVRLRLVLVYY